MLITNYVLFALLGIGLFSSRYWYSEDTGMLDISGAIILLVLGVTLIGFDEGITTNAGFTEQVNKTNTSETVTRTPVYEEISPQLSVVIQWVTLLGGIGAMLISTTSTGEQDPRGERGSR